MKETGKCFVYLLVFLLLPLAARAQGSKPAEGARFAFPGNRQVEITSCAPGVFRLRLIRANSADAENENLMDRYQILPARDCRAVEPGARNADGILFKSTGGSLRYDESTGKASLLNASGKVVVRSVQLMPDQANAASKDDIEQREKTVANQYKDDIQASLALNNPGALAPMPPDAIATSLEKGFAVSAELEPGERFYGLGEPSTKHIQLRGEAYFNWVRYQLDEEPIPFLMSTNGWGIFVNTTWRNYFDVGKTNPDQLLVWGPEGNPDVYLITGENMPEMLNRYTALAGRAILLPKWAYGLHFGNFITSDQFEILDNALRFRQLHFPVDGFELEPGWMKQNYDFSTKKEWNTDRFYMQDWMRGKRRRPETFIGALDRLGINVRLWLCIDYDLTGEAERQVAARNNQPLPTDGPEAYFDHLKPFLDDGVAGWKIDPADYVDKVDFKRQYANHASEFQMHNLNPILVAKQIYEGQVEYTNRRPIIEHCGGGAGSQQYAAQAAGDIEGGPEGLAWMLNANMSGYMNTEGDMRVHKYGDETMYWPDGAGVHMGFFTPWSFLDGWAFTVQPWLAGEKIQGMMTDYARLRYRLLPYIYSAAYNGHRTGMPIMRPLPLVYPDDARLQDEVHEYMFGDSLLVAVFSPTVKLPAGSWIDYWTGKRYEGPSEFAYTPPENRGGGLFVRDGAILVAAPPMDFVGQRGKQGLDVEIFPKGSSKAELYEDDGVGMGYLQGEGATTELSASLANRRLEVKLAAPRGHYEGMPDQRAIRLFIHGGRPTAVTFDGKALSAAGWKYDASRDLTVVTLDAGVKAGEAHTVVLDGVVPGRDARGYLDVN